MINKKFNIKKEELYLFDLINSDNELLMTFKLKSDERVNLKKHFKNSTIVNIKQGCIFTVNGLNKLIEKENGLDCGNVDHSLFKVN